MDLSFERKLQIAVARADLTIEMALRVLRIAVPIGIGAACALLLLAWVKSRNFPL